MRDGDRERGSDFALANTDDPPDGAVDFDETDDAEPRALPSKPAEPTRNSPIGRYLVISRVGAGAMGVVYAAYDPDLDRRVALKLLRSRGSDFDTSRGHQRLLREAQAMARLSHPNVVAVHDVGEHDGRVFVAMEFVEGRTLGEVLEGGPLPWRQALDLFSQAGRGLAAAHAEGLVHRDFKPDNVMLDGSGRVRVMDFGLVRPGPRSPEDEREPDVDPPRPDVAEQSASWQSTLTQHGALVGTPAFMAPEQHAGAEAGPAADQFAWCVSLWAALFGQRPFSGSTLAELASNITLGKIEPAPPGPSVPRWLRQALRRGLSTKPEDRWPSMDAALDALARGRVRARVVVGALGVTVALAAAGATGLWQQHEERQRIAACDQAGAEIAEVWGEGARAELRAALVRTGVARAEVIVDKVVARLDGYATSWKTARTDACLAATVHEDWDPETYERAKWCLDDRRMGLEAFVDELAGGQVGAMDHAVEGAATLARIAPCGQADLLTRLPVPPAEQRDAMVAVRRGLSRARASSVVAAFERGLTEARDALQQAQALKWSPLAASARRHVGLLLYELGRHEDAARELEAAYFEAIRNGADEVALEAAEQLVLVAGYRQAQHEVGLRWARHADVLLDELADDAGLRRADHLGNLAAIRYALGEHELAAELHEEALGLREAALDPEHPAIADSLNDLAVVRYAQGRYDAGKTLHERALAIREQAFGAEHPTVAKSLSNLALVVWATGDPVRARTLLERSVEISTAVLGADHVHVATALSNLAVAYQEAGELDAAVAAHERALEIEEAAFGPEHPGVADSLSNLGNVELLLGAADRAQVRHERALEIREAVLGPTHADVGASVASLARVHRTRGAFDRAIALGERAMAIFEAAHGAEHQQVADAAYNLAAAHRDAGHYAQASALLERAVAIYEKALGSDHESVADTLIRLAEVELDAGELEDADAALRRAEAIPDADAVAVADARLAHAEASWQVGGERQQRDAIAAAELARNRYRRVGAQGRDGLAKAEAWLASHPLP